MHLFYVLVFGPILLLLLGTAVVGLMILGALVVEFPVLILPAAAFGWLLKTTSRRSQDKHVPCEQM